MQSIGPNASPAPVFTAGFPGIHSFVVLGTSLLGAVLDVNGAQIGNTSVVSDSAIRQIAFDVYLASGDVLSYEGPAADLAGVRVGDEL